MTYTQGIQPCQDFKPKREGNGYGAQEQEGMTMSASEREKQTRRWGRLSNDVMADLFDWEKRLIRLGVPEKEAERCVDKCWKGYAKLLLDHHVLMP